LSPRFIPARTAEQKLGLNGASYELVAALTVVTAYFSEKSKWDAIAAHQETLQSALLDYLASKGDGVTVWGERSADPTIRVPTVSFTVKGWSSRELVEAVERVNPRLGIRSGSFYSIRLVREVLGLDPVDGVVRVSIVHYNTGEFSP